MKDNFANCIHFTLQFANRDIPASCPAERDEIYKTLYWDVVHGDTLPFGVDLAAFDLAVDMGPSRAVEILAQASRKTYPHDVIKHICAQRMTFLYSCRALARSRSFGYGRHIAACEAAALGMASSNPAKTFATAANEASVAIERETTRLAVTSSIAATIAIASAPAMLDPTGAAVAMGVVFYLGRIVSRAWYQLQRKAALRGRTTKGF